MTPGAALPLLSGWHDFYMVVGTAAATLTGLMFVAATLVVLPFMRAQRSGLVVQISSTRYAEPTIDDYSEKTRQTITAWNGMNGHQGGEPAKLAQALITIASDAQPPRRFIAGADAIATVEQKIAEIQAQVNAYCDLSSALALDGA